LIGYIVWGLLFLATWWVYTDAKSRNMNAGTWAAYTFLLLIIGFPHYLYIRGNHPTTAEIQKINFCASCGKQLETDAPFCPYCGINVKDIE